jgi:hypothetical protein
MNRVTLPLNIVSQIPDYTIRPEVSKWQPAEAWVTKLGQTNKGQSLVLDRVSAGEGGILTTMFTSPQTIDLLNSDQIKKML